jgi:hypothetical protein
MQINLDAGKFPPLAFAQVLAALEFSWVLIRSAYCSLLYALSDFDPVVPRGIAFPH